MAILKDLIVNGAARFIGDAYFATIKSGVWNGSKITKDYLPTFALTLTTTSTADTGTNTWSITFDGTSIGSFSVKNGSKGSTGSTGTRGATITTGTSVTGNNASGISATVADSKANDLYINTSNWNIYKASATNTWGKIGNIKGATGASTASTITWTDKKDLNIVGAIGFRGGNNEIYYDSGGLNYNASNRTLSGANSIWTDPKANTESNLGIKKTNTNAGSIYLYSLGSTTGARGIYCQNLAGKYLSLISTDKDNNVYIGGKINIDNNGYLYTGWISTASGGFNNFDTESVNRIYCSNDLYIRYLTPNLFISKLNLLTTNTADERYLLKFAWWNNSDSNNVNDLNGGVTFAYTSHGAPTTGIIASFNCYNNTDYTLLLLGSYNSENLYFRNKNGDKGTWNTWRYIIHDGNIGSLSVKYAVSAGSVAWANTGHPSWIGSSKPTYNWSEITLSGANNIEEGMDTFTDNTEIFSSFASDYGFADSNATGKVYRRNALKMYKYIKGKLDSVYLPKGTYLTSHLSLSNYVTLDETQTITGIKTFSHISLKEGQSIGFREANANYYTLLRYDTVGNEALILGMKNKVTSFIVKSGDSGATATTTTAWYNLVPSILIKGLSLYINELIPNGVTPDYNFKVNGNSCFTGNSIFSSSVKMDSLTAGNFVVLGNSSLGTITSGTWNGSVIDKTYLGISNWAKATSKPSYTADEVNALSIYGGTLLGELYMDGDFGINFNNSTSTSIYYSVNDGLSIHSEDLITFYLNDNFASLSFNSNCNIALDTTACMLTGDLTISGKKTFSTSVYAPAYYQTSDINYKNIKDYISLNNSDIANLPIFNFTWKNIKDSDMLSGTSALDILKLLPNIVKGDNKLTIDYGALGTILSINAAREIERLKKKIKELEDKLNGR